MMRFASTLALAVCAITPTFAQTAGRHRPNMPVVRWLGFRTDTIARDGLSQGLRELGYALGLTIPQTLLLRADEFIE